ncbi:MAG TPA: choice-of-anchor P family protein [Candidatus Thermoplasmatota archaeon]|nr:choice-of-anchor P family protein [Candidatus Thermoplasmatota archaeon]
MASYRRIVLALSLTALLVGSTLLAGTAAAAHDRGLFELDGNVADAAAGAPYDWASTFSASGVTLLSGLPLRVSAFGADHMAPDLSYHGPGSKDIQDMTSWQCTSQNSPQDKTDLLNGYAVMLRGSSGADHLYFGFERATNNGNSFMGVWFLQNPTGCTLVANGGTGWFTAGHTTGDLLLLSDFTGGGSVATVAAYRWNPAVANNLQLIASHSDCSTAPANDVLCGRVNSASLTTPWAPGATSPLASNTFLEIGTNLTGLLGAGNVPCFAQVMFETRTSAELSAQLKDFVLRDFHSCDARISVSPLAATDLVGQTRTFTFTVTKNTAGTWVAAAGETVQARIVSGPGSFVGPTTCVTGAAGTCTVTLTSSVSGQTVLAGDVALPMQQSIVRRSTDGTGGNSGPATQTWVRIPSATVTTPTAASLALGGSVADGIVVSGDLGTPTGLVDVHVCAPAQVVGGGCPAGGTFVGQVSLSGGIATSPSFTPTHAGTWCFRADYLGDATYLPSTDASPTECFVVTRATPTLSTTSLPNIDGVAPGASVADAATVTGLGGAFPLPTGAVAFHLCAPNEVTDDGCPAGGLAVGSAVLDAAGAATSPSTSATSALGKHCWRAEYAGDANYLPVSHTNADSECFVVRDVSLALAKSASVAQARPGDEVVYTLTLTATGNTAATDVVLRDTVPARSTLVDCGGCVASGTAAGSELSWTFPSVTPPASPSVSFRVALDPLFPAGLTQVANVATVASAQTGETPSNEVLVDVLAISILQLEKRVALVGGEAGTAVDALPGDEVEYVLTLRASGDAPATGIEVRDVVPPRATLVSCDGCAFEGTASGSTLAWTLASLEPGAASDLRFRVALDAVFPAGVTLVPNVASVTSAENGAQTSNEAVVSVLATPALELAKGVRAPGGDVAETLDAFPGDEVEFVLTVRSVGNAPASDVVVRDTVPARSTLVSCGGCDGAGSGELAWTLATLAPGGSVELSFRVALDAVFPAGETIVPNVATVASAQTDEQASNSVEVRVVATPAIHLVKSVSLLEAAPGDELEYVLTVRATGDAPVTDVVVRDTVPARSTLVSCDGCTYDGTAPGSTLAWDVGALTPPESATMRFRVLLDAVFPAGTTLVPNVASASSAETGDVDSNEALVSVLATPALELEKRVSTPGGAEGASLDAVPGGEVVFRLALRSTGNAPASGVALVDTVPARSTLLSCDGCAFEGTTPGSTLAWSLGTLAPGETVEVEVRVALDASFPAGVTIVPNVATVSSDETGELSSNLVEVLVLATPALGLEKAADVASASAGDLVTFTLRAYNGGDGDVEHASVVDLVPEGTEFVACSGDCLELAGVVTWAIGPLPAHTSADAPAASVTLTVRVLDAHGCSACNVATLASPAQPGLVESNLVCVQIVPDLDLARATGKAVALRVEGLGLELLRAGAVAEAQAGAGEVSDAAEELRVAAPADVASLSASAVRSSTRSSIGASGATTLSYAEVVELRALGGLVTASKVRAVAQTTATPSGATFSSAGTSVVDLRVMGVLYPSVEPGTRIELPAALFGAGSHVLVGGASGASAMPPGASGGFYEAGLETVALRIVVADADPLAPGAQRLEIEVARAVADAVFPQETPCAPAGPSEAAAQAAVMRAGDAAIGSAAAPASGGSGRQALAGASLGLVDAGASVTEARTELGDGAATAIAIAQAADVCVALEAGECVVRAELLRADARVLASDATLSKDASGSRVAGLVVRGVPVVAPVAPNTLVELPGLGFVVLDERLDAGSTLVVRALRLVVTQGPLAGSEVVVAEAAATAQAP